MLGVLSLPESKWRERKSQGFAITAVIWTTVIGDEYYGRGIEYDFDELTDESVKSIGKKLGQQFELIINKVRAKKESA